MSPVHNSKYDAAGWQWMSQIYSARQSRKLLLFLLHRRWDPRAMATVFIMLMSGKSATMSGANKSDLFYLAQRFRYPLEE